MRHRSEQRTHDGLPYLLFEPSEAATGRPLIVFLHGSGERGDSTSTLGRLTTHSLPRLAQEDRLPQIVGEFVLVCPQTARRWEAEVEALAGLVDALVTHEGVDRDRCYVTGVSMGAIGCWHAAAAEARPFAALIAVSWGLPAVARTVDVPAWVIVGGRDDKVDPRRIEQELYAARPRDERTKLTVDPRGRHSGSFWDRVYGQPALYDWLSSYRR